MTLFENWLFLLDERKDLVLLAEMYGGICLECNNDVITHDLLCRKCYNDIWVINP